MCAGRVMGHHSFRSPADRSLGWWGFPFFPIGPRKKDHLHCQSLRCLRFFPHRTVPAGIRGGLSNSPLFLTEAAFRKRLTGISDDAIMEKAESDTIGGRILMLNIKRFLCLILAAVLCVGLLPASVSAGGPGRRPPCTTVPAGAGMTGTDPSPW